MKRVGFSPPILTRQAGRTTCAPFFRPAPTGKFPPTLNGHVQDAAVTSGFSSTRRCPPAWRENLVRPFSPGRWNVGINSVSTPTTVYFRVRTRCQRAVLRGEGYTVAAPVDKGGGGIKSPEVRLNR